MITFLKNNIRKIRYLTTLISILLTVASLLALSLKGLNFGLDFTGGIVSEIKVDKHLTREDLLEKIQPNLGDTASVIKAGEEGRWIIRYSAPDDSKSLPSVAEILTPISSQVSIISNSIVGAQVGQDLYEQGGLALLAAILSILGYLCVRFEWRLASGALCALAHDIILVFGFFAFTQLEFNLTVFAAILAILGYSLNDSIIISDRIRELLKTKPDWLTANINDEAVFATFSRTMVTSGTTLITVSALWMMGGSALAGFSIAMFIGVLSGTWSSISVGTVLPEWLKLEAKHYQVLEVDTAP